MADPEVPEEMRDGLRAAWHAYVDLVTPLRPALHRYCLRLTRDVWDAEDLVADTLLRAFATLGKVHQEVRNHRSYLLRTATNVWIDAVRRRATAATAPADGVRPNGGEPEEAMRVGEAGATLLVRLAPRERAAIVLKDVFDLSLEETAEVLETTVGAVKAALHRGRERLLAAQGRDGEDRPAERGSPSPELVDRFVRAFNAADIPGLAALLLDTATHEHVGVNYQFGREALQGRRGWLRGMVVGHPGWPEIFQWEHQRAERREYGAESIAVFFRTRMGFEACEQVVRFAEDAGRIARIRDYSFCPETAALVVSQLGEQYRGGLYRPPTPTPGAYWPEE